MKLESPVRDEEVNLATPKVFRQKGRRQKRALGLTAPLKAKILAACPDDLRGLRDHALIAVGYDTLCRRSELVALRIEDITTAADGSGTILVRKAKADQFGRGRLAYLSADTLSHVNRWIATPGLDTGTIFRSTRREAHLDLPIASCTIPHVLKTRAEAGIDAAMVRRLSGHSMRVGAAQDMVGAGIELVAIMHVGGWKSPEMVMRYIEHMDVRRSGIARLYEERVVYVQAQITHNLSVLTEGHHVLSRSATLLDRTRDQRHLLGLVAPLYAERPNIQSASRESTFHSSGSGWPNTRSRDTSSSLKWQGSSNRTT